MKNNTDKGYNWNYVSLGGVTRVAITSGEDIAHLGELDQKKWTVLSCPVKGLEFDEKTLSMIDTDGDGKIRVQEMIRTAEWLTSIIKDKDSILKGSDILPLSQIDDSGETGARLKESAKQILKNLGLEKDEICTADTSDSVAIFKDTKFNGDGIITASSTDDEVLKAVIGACTDRIGSETDRNGEAGITAGLLEKFYTACADYAAWMDAAEADKANVFPFGDDTEAAFAACEAIKDKVADYFMRCKLINFDNAVSAAVDVSADKISAISDKNLSVCSDEIATYPLARPTGEQVLPFGAINPAWQAAFDAVRGLVLDSGLAGKDSMTEAEWNCILAKFGPYVAWKDAKKGTEVEALGLETVRKMLSEDRKGDLLALIEQDLALKADSESIDEVCKLSFVYRDFAKLLRNYVAFVDFYSLYPEVMAVFEAGKLYIDERCCELCIKVEDMGQHGGMAKLSNMFLLYCACTSKTLGKSMNIVAVMTAGKTRDLRPGKNGIFYDREGNDWDAVITSIVENPISVRQAFWAPYRKFANFISEKISKSAADKDAAATAKLQSGAAEGAPKQAFDPTKLAITVSMITIAVAAIVGAVTGIIAILLKLSWWKWLILIAAIMLLISGPSCFIAWLKLRKRNLGPVLNANGWAINSLVLVNILFGGTLTSVAKYPVAKGDDPFKKKTPWWRKMLRWLIALLIIAFGVLYFTDNLGFMGIHKKVKAEKEAVEAVETPATPAEEAAETAPEAE